MKKNIIIAAIAIVLIVGIVLLINPIRSAIAYNSMTPLETGEIVPGVYAVQDDFVNLFLMKAGETIGSLIFDVRKSYFLSYFFTIFVLLEFWNMFNAKAFGTGKSTFAGINKNSAFLGIMIFIFIGQILIVTFGGDIFRTVPLTIRDWLIITGFTSLVLWIGEIVRMVRQK